MSSFIEKIRKIFPRGSEFIRFLIIGGISTLIDMFVMAVVIYLPCRHHFSNFLSVFTNSSIAPGYLVAIGSLVGFLVGLGFNFVFSIYYVYLGDNKYVKNKKSFLIFTLLSLIGLVIQTAGVFVGYEIFKINEWIMKIIFIVIVLIFNYITRKKFIFNKNEQKREINKESLKGKIKILDAKDYKYLTFFAFSALFFIYLVICIVASYYFNTDGYNTLFGNDTPRVIGDWSNYWKNHSHTNKHPIYVLSVYPIIAVLKMLGLNSTFAIIIFLSFIATVNVYLVYKILIKITHKNLGWLLFIWVGLYAFAFAQIGHILIIESFILGAFSLLAFWTYFVYNFRQEKKWYHLVWQLGLIGTLTFSFQTTNIFHFLLGSAVLLIFNKKKKFKRFLIDICVYLLVVFVTFAISYLLVCVQESIFPSAEDPFDYLWAMISDLLHRTSNASDTKYVNKEISFDKLITELVTYFGVSFSGGKVYYNRGKEWYNNCVWVVPNIISYVVTVGFVVLLVYSFVVSLKKKLNVHLVLALLGCFLFEFVFHYFYGYKELMLYSVNFSFILYLIFANGLSVQGNNFKKCINWVSVGLCALCVVSSLVTMIFAFKEFYQNFGFSRDSVLKTNYYFILLTLLTLSSIYLFIAVKKYFDYRKNKTEDEKNDYVKFVVHLVTAVLAFVCVCLVISACVIHREKRRIPIMPQTVGAQTEIIEQEYINGFVTSKVVTWDKYYRL